jgi:hypothetical protein
MAFFRSYSNRLGHRSLLICIGIWFSCFCASGLTAQQPSWTVAGPAFSASVADIQAEAAKMKPEPFMEATVFYERDSYQIAASGAVTLRHTLLYRIESQTAVEGWSETSEHWDPWYQKQPEIHARVMLPNGQVSQLDQKTITDGPAKEGDDDTYTDERIRKAPLPGLAVGAIVEEETVLEDKMPFFFGRGCLPALFLAVRACSALRSAC